MGKKWQSNRMKLVDMIFSGMVVLLGTEGKHYLIDGRDLDEWKTVGWLRRN